VATPSPLAMKSVERLLKLLIEEGVKPLGVVENMSLGNTSAVQELCRRLALRYLGCVGMDPSVDSMVGDLTKFRLTRFFRDLRKVAEEIYKAGGPQ
jgi:MinD superfamily P-loop ATPase